MIDETTRPFTREERAQIESLPRGRPPHSLQGSGGASLTRRREHLAPKHRVAFRPEEFDDEEFPRDGEVLAPRRYRELSEQRA